MQWQQFIPWHRDARCSHSQSPHTRNFNKRLSLSIYIIYPLAVTSEVQIVFQALKLQPMDFIHFGSRCSGDKVPVYQPYLRLLMFHDRYNWSQMVHCILSFLWTSGEKSVYPFIHPSIPPSFRPTRVNCIVLPGWITWGIIIPNMIWSRMHNNQLLFGKSYFSPFWAETAG